MGDFNAIHKDSKWIGGHPRPLISTTEFNACLDVCGLVEMQNNGRSYKLV